MKYKGAYDKLSFFDKTKLSRILRIVCLVLLFISPSLAFSQKQNSNTIDYQVISANENTWGYNILMDGKLFIHQPFAPGISGNRGFSTKKKASSAAKLVIEKIKKGIMPPSLSVAEVIKIENGN
jgi:hypothetical protein